MGVGGLWQPSKAARGCATREATAVVISFNGASPHCDGRHLEGYVLGVHGFLKCLGCACRTCHLPGQDLRVREWRVGEKISMAGV